MPGDEYLLPKKATVDLTEPIEGGGTWRWLLHVVPVQGVRNLANFPVSKELEVFNVSSQPAQFLGRFELIFSMNPFLNALLPDRISPTLYSAIESVVTSVRPSQLPSLVRLNTLPLTVALTC